MAYLNQKIQNIPASPTTSMSALAKKIASEGHDVVSLAVGEPGFDTPEKVKQAGIQAINNNITKYTNVDGLEELRESIVSRYKRIYNQEFNANQICISSGAKHSIHNIFSCILEPNDEVIFFAPYWVSYPSMISLANAKPICIKTQFENNFEPNIDEIEKNINENTKAIIVNNPNNPTGLIYSKEFITKLANLIKKYPNIWVIDDDIYDDLYFNQRITLLTEVAPDLADRYVIASGISKNFAMTGWRVGFTIAPKLLNDAIKKFQSQSTTCACSISQYAAITAMNMKQDELQFFKNSYENKVNIVTSALDEIPYISYKKSQGTFYLFPNLNELIKNTSFKNDSEFCSTLLKEEYVATMPGSAFGLDGFIRISCANKDEELIKAMNRLKNFVNRHINK